MANNNQFDKEYATKLANSLFFDVDDKQTNKILEQLNILYQTDILLGDEKMPSKKTRLVNDSKFRKDIPVQPTNDVFKGCKVVDGYVETK